MKKLRMAALCCSLFTLQSFAQSESTGGFAKERLFTGGNLALGFGSGSTSIGIGPYFGYSLNKYVDVAVSLNYNYTSQRDYVQYGDKLRQSVIGPGIFTRLFPVKFLFAQAQFEQNFMKLKYLPAENGSYAPFSDTKSVSSFLIGPGYAGGREEGNNTYYYISVLFDVAKNKNSPYVDGLGRINPIIRAGFNIGLFQGRSARSRNRRM